MATALPAFLNQANKTKGSTASAGGSGNIKIDSLTNMSGRLVGGAAFTLSTGNLEIDSLTNTSGTHVQAIASGKPLKSYLRLVTPLDGGDYSSQASSIGNSYELTYSVQGSQTGQVEGVIAWSIGFADVVRPSSSQPSGIIGQPTGIIRGTFLF